MDVRKFDITPPKILYRAVRIVIDAIDVWVRLWPPRKWRIGLSRRKTTIEWE